ncbi:MAG: serine protein kinase RIO [Candidatus Diapherotrites archaeon]|nr:serine protein kinase RIO [Candidatus Diapherotrites archaeon]
MTLFLAKIRQEVYEKQEQIRKRKKTKSRSDRKIWGYVFDSATKETLFELQQKQQLESLESIISTGKEAYVFVGKGPGGAPVAVKVYKIETSSFNTMSKYIVGDPRFEKVKKDKRAIVYAWAKKEFRNLERASKSGVKVPLPIAQKNNVLIMELIGKKDEPALPMINTRLNDPKKVYEKVLEYIARLFYGSDLIHADLSEYNILINKKEPILIDMGQSVLSSHPMAQEFLDRDILHITNFFKGLGLNISIEDTRKSIRAWKERL